MRQNMLYVLLLSVFLLGLVIFFFPKKNNETVVNSQTIPNENGSAIKYMPLGDSYTIGEGVRESERFPNQLTASLKAKGYSIELLGNPSRTGYTTLDLIEKELPALNKSNATFITILIGVNDQVQGTDAATFRTRFEEVLSKVRKSKPKASLLVITIPNYSLTQSGSQFGNPTKNTEAIEAFNNIIKESSSRLNIPIVDISDISLATKKDSSLTASDNLHPSGKQYTLWVEKILPTAEALLR